MTSRKDDLDDLRAAMTAATPRADPDARAAHLRLARKNFDALHAARQGSGAAPRLTPERPKRGVFAGVRDMLNAVSTKGGLTVTTAIVAVGFLVLTPQGQDVLGRVPGLGSGTEPIREIELGTAVPDIDIGGTAPRDRANAPEVVPGAAIEADARSYGQATAEPAPAYTADVPTERAAADTGADRDGRAEDGAASPDDTVVADVEVAEEQGFATEIVEAPVVVIDPAPAPAPVIAGEVGRIAPAPAAPTGGMLMQGDTNGVVAPEPTIADAVTAPPPDTEAFAIDTPNPVRIAAEEPVSTFSIDVDTAAYALVRQSLNAGTLPPRDAVRIEEMINYFPYAYAAPEAGDPAPFLPTITVMDTPWNDGTQLVHIGLQGILPLVEDRPPLNLVFLIDTSGSMADANKLPLLRQSFLLMLDQLRPGDEVAIVEYAGSAGIALAPTPASDRAAIAAALMRLGAGGSTNGQGGLEQAYATAASMTADGEVSRVILATDGDFNVGLSGIAELEEFIAKRRDSGVYLSVLGFGRGNLDDATMQALAQNGNGIAAYIDTLNEAQKVLVDQLTGALFAIAGDVKVQVEWNPALVAEYRLIGYETRALAREDFNNDAVDAGDLGAGHSVTAIYEVTPVGSPAILNDALRYAPVVSENATEAAPQTGDVAVAELGFLRLRWKAPGEGESRLLETPIYAGATASPGTEAQFATAIAGFGQLLRGDGYLGDWGWDEAIALANDSRGEDPFGYRTEAVQLMRLAESLSQD